ncbi:PAS domain S-box protein [Segetibacter sp. 3557_3]|uniref:PAS domain-containing protein n=1 Tax=Segetibacter sp. 3557_3 TaxID=2547429 RepID=UPI00105890E0|nr:PAS domain-containing protein [Segetibacter sp. 3557_3]TDH29122.1 PAS domain S-box protein [Segetibacter sp. 3557_3]
MSLTGFGYKNHDIEMLTDRKTYNFNLDFKYLPGYASFLLDHKLEEYVGYQLWLSREIKLPVMKFLESMSEPALQELVTTNATIFLNYFKENNVASLIAESLQEWLSDKIPLIDRYSIVAADITQISYIRKQAFLECLPAYTTDPGLVIKIVKEIDVYVAYADQGATSTYIKLLEDKINEHIHFVEKITATTPGTIYVYDLEAQKEIYSNNKFHDLPLDEAGDVRQNSSHQDEAERPGTINGVHHKKMFYEGVADGMTISYEHRRRDYHGNYRWIRNYESVFKRDNNGSVVQVIGIALDIENEKKMADELRQREEQLLEAQSLAEIGSFNWNLVTEESDVTPQLMQIFELENQKKLGDFLAMVHPGDRHLVNKALQEAVNDTGLYDCEFRFLAKNKEKVIWSRGIVTKAEGQDAVMKGTVMDVTNRNHMIRQLQRSEELYKQAQSLTHLGNWTYEVRSGKITWTDELFRIFGLEPQSVEINMDLLLSFVQQRDQEFFLQTVSRHLESSRAGDYFMRIVRRDGTTRILHVKADVLLSNDEKVYKLIGTAQDVTEQKLNERRLRESQNFSRKITDATPSIIAAYNVNTGKYLFINQAFEKILGYSSEMLLSQGAKFLIDRIHPDDLQPLLELNTRVMEEANNDTALANERVVEFKYRVRHSNGSYRWLHTYGTVFDRNEQKKVEHILNVSLDITERIEAEDKLKEQEQLIQYIAEASPTILYLLDLPTRSIVYVNKEITPVLGYSPEEILQMKSDVLDQVFHQDDVKKFGELGSPGAETDIREYECKVRQKGDGWKCMLVREIVFKRNELQQPSMLLCAALDITERKRIEDALYEKTIELQQSNANLEEFAYVASHDLKEPLRKIATFGDRLMLNEENTMSDESLSYLNKMIDSSRRMQRMIDDLLSISMITGEKNYTDCSLMNILKEVLQTLEFKIEESKASITYDELPKARVSESQFRQLFQNLISNALKFSKKETTPVVHIAHQYLGENDKEQLRLSRSLRYLEISVTDNGIGFDEKHAQKIFTIFHRLHNKSEYEGTGIGLAICKKVVENHGGLIIAESVSNVGSKFRIIFPVS